MVGRIERWVWADIEGSLPVTMMSIAILVLLFYRCVYW